MEKKTSLCELLDQFVDAQRLDIKAYFSGHLNESKLYCPPCQTQYSSLTVQNRSAVMSHSMSKPGINVTTQKNVKKDARTESRENSHMRQHYKLKLLKHKNFPNLALTVDSKQKTSSAASNHILSTSELQGACRDDRVPVGKPAQKKSEQKHVREFDSADSPASHLPVTETSIPNIVPTYLKAATKKDQFRKMRDYHNNVIQCPSHVYQHALTGSAAVKYLEHRLQEV